jgi:glycosyltransferase involved in cell wall biosynthesis
LTEPKNNPFISIIIPTRNEERFLGACLDSLVNQTYPKDCFEVLIIDGLSEDQTLAIAKEYCQLLNIRFFTNPRLRSTYAFNKGIDEAKGGLFMIVNAHSYLDKNFISEDIKTYIEIKKNEPNLAAVGGIYRNVFNSTFGKLVGLLYYSSFSGASSSRYNIKPHFSDSVIFGVFDKQIVIENGKFDEDFTAAGNDNELAKRLRKRGFKLYTNPNIIAHYNTRSSFEKFFKQTFNYGVAQGIMVRKGRFKPDVSFTSSLWFVPIFFIIYLLSIPLLAAFSNVLLAFLPLCFYFIVGAFVAIKISFQEKTAISLFLVPLYFIFHATLGLSVLIGLVLKNKAFL